MGKHPALVVNMGVSSGECDVGSTKFRGTTGERWTFTASGPSTNLAAPWVASPEWPDPRQSGNRQTGPKSLSTALHRPR